MYESARTYPHIEVSTSCSSDLLSSLVTWVVVEIRRFYRPTDWRVEVLRGKSNIQCTCYVEVHDILTTRILQVPLSITIGVECLVFCSSLSNLLTDLSMSMIPLLGSKLGSRQTTRFRLETGVMVRERDSVRTSCRYSEYSWPLFMENPYTIPGTLVRSVKLNKISVLSNVDDTLRYGSATNLGIERSNRNNLVPRLRGVLMS